MLFIAYVFIFHYVLSRGNKNPYTYDHLIDSVRIPVIHWLLYDFPALIHDNTHAPAGWCHFLCQNKLFGKYIFHMTVNKHSHTAYTQLIKTGKRNQKIYTVFFQWTWQSVLPSLSLCLIFLETLNHIIHFSLSLNWVQNVQW